MKFVARSYYCRYFIYFLNDKKWFNRDHGCIKKYSLFMYLKSTNVSLWDHFFEVDSIVIITYNILNYLHFLNTSTMITF